MFNKRRRKAEVKAGEALKIFAHALCSSFDFKLPSVKNHIYLKTMFEALTDRFSKIFSVLSKKKNLTEANIGEALGDIRRALLASDVAFEVVETFIDDIKRECVGQAVFKNVQPGQQVVKIVHDRLVDILGDERSALNTQRPLNILPGWIFPSQSNHDLPPNQTKNTTSC